MTYLDIRPRVTAYLGNKLQVLTALVHQLMAVHSACGDKERSGHGEGRTHRLKERNLKVKHRSVLLLQIILQLLDCLPSLPKSREE
jgi:hypothetical protein